MVVVVVVVVVATVVEAAATDEPASTADCIMEAAMLMAGPWLGSG